MSEWWESLSILQKIFAYVALPATFVLIIQTVLVLFGLGDHDLDAGHGFDAHGFHGGDAGHGIIGSHADHAGHGGPGDDSGLALFSIRGIVAFFAVGGWAGIVAAGLSILPILCVAIAIVCGAVALYAVAWIFHIASKLQSAGNLSLVNAVGKEATVYITVPGARRGLGKVTLTFQGRFAECDAVSDTPADLKTGTAVAVVGLMDENTLIVSPVSEHTEINQVEVEK
jgi:hypothetical protein